ncbi:MAG: N-acetylmuramoyl-L-alanine amidase CwlD [Acholeplasmataceae bacterium]|jgi:N-acetylmuramoyl-L-alanine amidase|nr:N-acetylmuramoyl-L-alanine amidase CwlD [Acholeplasmataceae bacterium]
MKVKQIFNILILLILFVTSVGTVVVSKNITKQQKTIYIDPGHGGPDGGAVGLDRVYEKDIVLSVSKKLAFYLGQAGYNVQLTRNGDYDLAGEDSVNRKRDDIYKRVDMINASDCLLYVSIHANIFSSPRVYGAQVFYKTGSQAGEILASEIQEAIKSLLQNTERVAKSITDKYLIDNVQKTGCLVEIGFLSNPEEVRLLQEEFYQEKMAYAIYLGIASYLVNN